MWYQNFAEEVAEINDAFVEHTPISCIMEQVKCLNKMSLQFKKQMEYELTDGHLAETDTGWCSKQSSDSKYGRTRMPTCANNKH